MTYTLPNDINERPVVVVGAGTLGARIALMFAVGGSAVRIVNRSHERAQVAQQFVLDRAPEARVEIGRPAAEAVPGAWLVIETLAEDLELKREVMGELDRLADADAILATNSSSYCSREMLDRVEHPGRVLNMHFLMPPEINPVELMSCGQTDEAIIDALVEVLPRFGLSPYRVRRESAGFIFNRLWAAIKRETLMTVEEGAATHEDIDRLWQEVFHTSVVPFRMMDQVGLDVVLDIEEHYAAVRDGIPEGPRVLLRDHVRRGRLGVKSGRGFYDDYAAHEAEPSPSVDAPRLPR
jgi:3-hydroxybutyryl-CoA dehydrogenase